jgi:hypothetical protein
MKNLVWFRPNLAWLILLLVSCAPAQDFTTGAVNKTTGDEAVLAPDMASLIFAPAGTVTDVLVDVLGEQLKSLDPKDNCIGTDTHLQCLLGDVSELTVIEMTGVGVSAVATYRRAGELRLEALTVGR